MSIDRQRIQAVNDLQALGFQWTGTEWKGSVDLDPKLLASSDALYELHIEHIEQLAGVTEDSEEANQLERIVLAVESYEVARWPQGRGRGQ